MGEPFIIAFKLANSFCCALFGASLIDMHIVGWRIQAFWNK